MIKVFEAFAGVGTQRMALNNRDIEHEVTAISEVDEYAILSYHAIHTADIEVKEASEEEMQRYMEKKNIPLDPNGKRKILKNKRLKDLYVASVASNNLGDISKITDDKIPRVDLFTYSFPCQDISLAGKQRGLDKNSGTRSSLLWECEKIIETVKPKYLLMENVKALVNKNNKPQFDIWLEYLEELGYKNFWEVLNAKDYGIPQNRERVFVVSILDENSDYKFPTKIPLALRLEDMLEDNVDDSYYLSQEQVDRITFSTYDINRRRIQEKEYSDTLCGRGFKDPKCVRVEQIGQYDTPTRQNANRYRVYDKETISPSLTTMGGGNLEPHIIDYDDLEDYELVGTIYSNASKRFMGKPMKGLSKTLKAENPDTSVIYKKKDNNIDESNESLMTDNISIGASRGRYTNDGIEQQLEINKTGNTNTITSVQKDNYVVESKIKQFISENYKDARDVSDLPKVVQAVGDRGNHSYSIKDISNTIPANAMSDRGQKVIEQSFRIRKLTPLECWRLMGIADKDFEKASKVVSNSQLYKQAGNAIVVDVLEGIFKQLFNSDENNIEGVK